MNIMDIANDLIQNFLSFFSWEEFSFLLTPTGMLVMVNLVLSEGLLSFDNALVLAVLVSHLPRNQYYRLGPFNFSIQQWALTAGLLGAYFFRVVAIGLGTYLMRFWILKLLGGGYLLWLAYDHFLGHNKDDDELAAYDKGFWETVLKVELMDIAFSIDSILAALGISSRKWVILAGGMLGILCMRFVAGIFVTLIQRFPLFKHTGFGLIVLIGHRLVSEVEWSHCTDFFTYIGPNGLFILAVFLFLVYSAAHSLKKRLSAIKPIIQLSLLIILICWSSHRFALHMSDLTFSVLMLATFASTFLFNGLYSRLSAMPKEKCPSTIPSD